MYAPAIKTMVLFYNWYGLLYMYHPWGRGIQLIQEIGVFSCSNKTMVLLYMMRPTVVKAVQSYFGVQSNHGFILPNPLISTIIRSIELGCFL